MTWVLWRQHRAGAAVATTILAAFAVAVALTGRHMAGVYHAALTNCTGGQVCLGHLFSGYGAIIDAVHLTIVLPVLLGAFLGATLIARETDHGTHVLVWTQGITRRRWIVAKISFAVASTVALATITSALVTWWSGTPNALNADRFQGAQFDTQNVAPIAHALFAVGLGILAGALLRRTLPAIAATIGAYVGVRLLVAIYLRPHYATAHIITTVLGASDDAAVSTRGAWTLASRIVDPNGRPADGTITIPGGCAGQGRDTIERCLGTLGYRRVSRLHPASTYWHFQTIEAALFTLVAAVAIAAAAVITLRRDA